MLRVVTRLHPSYGTEPSWVAEVEHLQAITEGPSKEQALVNLRLLLAEALNSVDKALESK